MCFETLSLLRDRGRSCSTPLSTSQAAALRHGRTRSFQAPLRPFPTPIPLTAGPSQGITESKNIVLYRLQFDSLGIDCIKHHVSRITYASAVEPEEGPLQGGSAPVGMYTYPSGLKARSHTMQQT